MNNKTAEAYHYYKSKCGTEILLFRVRDNYEAYFEDAENIGQILRVEMHTELVGNVAINKIALPALNILDVISDLSCNGVSYRLIQSRNAAGEFDIPDVEQIKREQNMDF